MDTDNFLSIVLETMQAPGSDGFTTLEILELLGEEPRHGAILKVRRALAALRSQKKVIPVQVRREDLDGVQRLRPGYQLVRQ